MKALPVTIVGLLLSVLIFSPVSLDASDPARRQDKKNKAVTTLLNAKWRVAPIVLEIAEYLGEENSDFFWSFVNGINQLNPPLVDLETDKEKYNEAIKVASKLLSPSRLKVLKLGLSLHINSPLVEMFGQMALERGVGGKDCLAVADIDGELICDSDELNDAVKQASESRIETYQVDHHFPGSANRSVTAVLYGELGTREFSKLHATLIRHAENGKIDYVIRWFVKHRSPRRLRLSGYGVELQLKSTEYKSQDDTAPGEEGAGGDGEPSSEELDENDPQSQIEGFNFARLKNLFPDLRTPLEKFKRHLSEQESELAPLKVWQFQGLSLQAAEAVMAAPPNDALSQFTSIAQNFPMQAHALVRIQVSTQLKEEIKNNQELFASTLNVHPTDSALFVNGMFFDMDLVDIITLLQVLRQELTNMEGLHSLGLSNSRMSKLLSLDLNPSGQSQASTGMLSSPSNAEFAMDIRDTGILWVNDMETDSQYKRWSNSYMELLRPTYPGMLRNVRRNMYNLVLIVDPTAVPSRALVKLAESFVKHSAPVRIGLAMKVNEETTMTGLKDAGVGILCAYNYLSQEKSPRDALAFLINLYDFVKDEVLTVTDVKKKLKEAGGFGVDVEDVLGEDSDYDFGRKLTNDFISRTGMHVLPQALMNGIPLPEEDLTADTFEETILTEVMQQTSRLQKAVFRGELTDQDDIMDYLMGQPHVMPRLNQRILHSETSQYLDMSGKPSTVGFDPSKLSQLMQLSNSDMTATALKILKYFEKAPSGGVVKSKKDVVTSTIWVVGDLNCPKARKTLRSAIDYMKSNKGVRVTFLPNINGDSSVDQSLNKVVVAALNVLPTKEAVDYVSKILADEGCHEKKNCDIISELVPALNKQDWLLKVSRVYATRVLGFKSPGQAGLVYNGRVLGPFRDGESFGEEDFLLMERFSNQVYADKIWKVLFPEEKASDNSVLDENEYEDDDLSKLTPDSVLKMIGLLISRPQGRARFDMPAGLRTQHSVLTLPPLEADSAAFHIAAVVDPVSRGAQKMGPLLTTLRQVLNCEVKLYLNSVEKNSDMPLKSFYRFVVEPEPQFGLHAPHARFTHLPQSSLLTLSLHVPGNWLVESVRSVYDLDNIRLADVEKVVHSEFELEYLLLEGHCWDAAAGTPPRGLQVTLGTQSDPTQVDTIVMANLGYFQLKANPGAWILKLRQGRSADIYDIVSHEGSDTPPNSTDIKVLISSLRSHVLKLRVAKKPGKQMMDLLTDTAENTGGIWNSITSSFSTGDTAEKEDERINIFSLASGHLYERFLRIMMLSVLKHTKTPVKFWFLKNYLSPSLKDILPYMAKEYGFDYELIQYKWPRWLHQQTEKQRVIWGYKILFLDVLFPLDVKKIIFVDADQIVRADMKELVDLDLGGAPYGYTPFCESRVEMDGFRFWKLGYWRNHLQGRRYHISALYVVDLKRFRRIAAGDRLRGQYQALSQDPNSLSNLDQDLPNNMIHQVAIKSLPQEWLWCETWCDDASKSTAKTIDLCNNPQTKEAKLTAAVRIVPEWSEYDDEIKRLQQRIQKGEFSQDIGDHADPTLEVERIPDPTSDDVRKQSTHSEL